MVAEAKRLRAIESSDFQVKLDLKQSIKPGDSLKSVALIKDKLAFLGFYQPDTINPPNLYDEMAVEAIRELQEQFGYNMDGAIGKNTLKALNMPVEQKINQLYVNMERLRWMPDSLEKVYLMVNIADFTLNVFSGNDTLLSMRTIVGKDARETPVFNSRITYMVMSPSWHVPPTIKKQDVIPSVIKDISYLEKKQMKVIDAKGNVVDPSTVNWKRDGMKYSIKQQPGAQNSLGKVKFMFPNKHNIYLHDTPSRSLFARDERTFSSGCIRVEKPFELASLLLSDKPEWTPERIKQAMDSGVEKTIVLKDKVGVYIYYLTAWGSASGKINYRADVYNRDKVIEEALSEKSLNKVL
jgi:murein L,D-transpeptidase YcbB/YkuD